MFDKLKVYNAKYKLFLAEKPGSNQVHFRQYVWVDKSDSVSSLNEGTNLKIEKK